MSYDSTNPDLIPYLTVINHQFPLLRIYSSGKEKGERKMVGAYRKGESSKEHTTGVNTKGISVTTTLQDNELLEITSSI